MMYLQCFKNVIAVPCHFGSQAQKEQGNELNAISYYQRIMLRTFLNKIYILIIYFPSSSIEDLLSNTLSLAFATCMHTRSSICHCTWWSLLIEQHMKTYTREGKKKKRLDLFVPICTSSNDRKKNWLRKGPS